LLYEGAQPASDFMVQRSSKDKSLGVRNVVTTIEREASGAQGEFIYPWTLASYPSLTGVAARLE